MEQKVTLSTGPQAEVVFHWVNIVISNANAEYCRDLSRARRAWPRAWASRERPCVGTVKQRRIRSRRSKPNSMPWTEALDSLKAIGPLNPLAPGARPASASIVARYHETVRRLAAEGEGHPRIPDVIVRESQGRFFGQRQHGIPVLAQTAARKRPSWEQPIRKSGLRSDEEALIRAPPLRSPA